MRQHSLGWPFGPPLLLVLSSLMLTVTSITVQKSDLVHLGTPETINVLLPSFYKPPTDEICFRNGLRYTNCEPDNGTLVKLDSLDRMQLFQLLQQKHSAAGTIQSLVWFMLVNLDQELTAQSPTAGESMKERVGAEWHRETGDKTHRLTAKQSEFDPAVLGPAAAKKLGATAVTDDEERCYTHWLKAKDYAEVDVNTVLNELYVRHVAITQGAKKVWDMDTPTGCYRNPGVRSDVGSKEYMLLDEVEKLRGPLDGMPLQQRSPGEEQDDGIVDDMQVYHQTFDTHLQDPWAKEREVQPASALQRRSAPFDEDVDGDSIPDDMEVFHSAYGTHLKDPWAKHGKSERGKAGHTRRSIGGHGRAGVHHRRVAAGMQPQSPLSPFGTTSDYSKGMPIAPTQQTTGAGSGSIRSTSGSAISSKPHGFAASVTGGGSATPIIPKDIHELVQLLQDPQPRVIHLDKVYDFRGSEGVCTNCAGCMHDSYAKCGDKGQLAIDNGQGWCAGKSPHAVTYDKAGLTPICMTSNKSIIGISANAALRGKGLRIAHQKNVILHNFRIDEINAPFIWGGDGITLYDTDLIWMDRLTFSNIGRQFIVTGYQSAGRVTISNCFFDCVTRWSATCDGSHYWTVLGYGTGDKVTFSGNLMKNCSGRSPRIANSNQGGDAVWHVVNTVFDTSTGHSFDMGPGVSVLIEGNVFSNVAQTSLHENSPGRAFAPADRAVCSQCKGTLGRDCQPNVYKNANPVPSTTTAGQVLKDVAAENMGGALPPAQVVKQIGQTAGCGGKGAASVAGTGDGAQKGSVVPVAASSQPQTVAADVAVGGGGAGPTGYDQAAQRRATGSEGAASDAEKKQQRKQQKEAEKEQKKQQRLEREKQRQRDKEEQRRKQVQLEKLKQQQQQPPPEHY